MPRMPRRPHARWRPVLLLATLAVLLAAAPATAHVAPAAATVTGTSGPASAPSPGLAQPGLDLPPAVSLPPASDASWPLALPLALALGVGLFALVRGIPRRIRLAGLVAGLVAGLAVLAFETGVHSVHHLGEARSDVCAVAATATQLAGAPIEASSVEPVLVATPEPLPAVAPISPAGRTHRPDEGRAPPPTASA
jgi:hypothetical protein